MNLNIQNRQQFLTILALLAVGLWVGNKLIFNPLTDSWASRRGRIAALKKSVAEGNQLIEREQALRDRWEMMRTNTLPPQISEAQAKVLRTLTQWAKDNRISLSSLNPQWKPGEDYSALEVLVD